MKILIKLLKIRYSENLIVLKNINLVYLKIVLKNSFSCSLHKIYN